MTLFLSQMQDNMIPAIQKKKKKKKKALRDTDKLT